MSSNTSESFWDTLKPLLGGSLSLLGAGALEMGGDLLARMFDKVIGVGTSGSYQQSGQLQGLAAKAYAKELMGLTPGMNEADMYSAAGLTGRAAGEVARQKIEGLMPSVTAATTASQLQQAAGTLTNQALSNIATTNALMSKSDRQTRQAFMDQLGGASPAAKIAMLNKLGDMQSQNRLQAQQQNIAALSDLAKTKSQMLATATDVINKDLETGFTTKVRPYLVEKGSLGNQMLSGATAVAGSAATQAQLDKVSNPLGSLASNMATLGSLPFNEYYMKKMTNSMYWNQEKNRKANSSSLTGG